MQALHEECERRAASAQKLTEALQLKEAELTIMRDHVTASQKRIQELQQRYAQEDFRQEYLGEFSPAPDPMREIAAIEDKIMGVPRPSSTPSKLDLLKYASDGEASLRDKSGEVQEKARLFKLQTGRSPSWKEIQAWTGSK